MSRYQVWWIPQIPGTPFTREVSSVKEGRMLCDVLADYDLFQFENRIKPDYSNAGGVEEFIDGEWFEVDDDFEAES